MIHFFSVFDVEKLSVLQSVELHEFASFSVFRLFSVFCVEKLATPQSLELHAFASFGKTVPCHLLFGNCQSYLKN
jgi:hypothetical protein